MTTLRLQVAPRVGPLDPRGARLGAAIFIALWRGLGRLGRLGRQAAAQGKTPAQEAQAVREMASELQHSDPRFAADLYAAANRHEQLHGGL